MTFAIKEDAVKNSAQVEAKEGGAIDESTKITERQKEVLKLIARNIVIIYNEIAEALGIN